VELMIARNPEPGSSLPFLVRARENRSPFVFTRARGREVVFWQTARTAKQARPAVSVPHARAAGQVLAILVDVHERCPWTFSAQQARTERRPLPAGGYGVERDGRLVAAVERKSLADLVASRRGPSGRPDRVGPTRSPAVGQTPRVAMMRPSFSAWTSAS
jgi:hypothetical protein